VSPALQGYVIGIVQHGGAALAAGGSGGASGPGGGVIGQLYRAGYAAFASALHAALYLSAGLLAAAALLAAITLRGTRPDGRPEADRPSR
jgi:hypothetical protein